MERIDLLSTGGALPWAGPLGSLARLPCRGLSFLFQPFPTPPPHTHTHSLYLSLSLCVAAASPPADTCPAVTGRDVRWAADTRIDLPPFPHKLHIKLPETLEETKDGRRDGDKGVGENGRGGEENIVNSHHLFKLTMFGVAKEIENTQLTVFIGAGSGKFCSNVAWSYTTKPNTWFPNVRNSSYFPFRHSWWTLR